MSGHFSADDIGDVSKRVPGAEPDAFAFDAQSNAEIEKILAKYPAEEVAVYLNAFYTMNDVRWPNLESMLKTDPRLQFGG